MLHSVFSRFLQIFQANNLSRSDWIGFNKDINKFDDVYLEIFALSYRNNETFFKKLLSLSNHVHKSRIFDAQYHFSMKVILSYRVIAADINRIRENELWSQKNDEIVECLYETHPNLWRDFDGAQSGADLKKNAIEYVKEMLKNDSNEYNHKIAELYAVIKHFIKDNINIQQEFSRILINGAHMSFNFYKNYNKSNNLVSFFLWLLYFFNKHQKNLNTTTLQLTINPDQYYEWLEVLLQFSGTTPNTFISPKDFFEGTDELFGSFLDLRHNTQLEWAIAECVTRRDHTMLKGIRNFAISDVAYRDLLDVLKKIVQNTPPECTAVLMMAFHALPRVEFNMLAQGCLNKHNITCVIDLLTNGFTNYDNPIYCAIIKTLHGPHSYLLAVLCNDIISENLTPNMSIMQNLYKLQVVFRDDDSSSQKISVNFAASILCYAFLDFELASLHREVIKIIVTAISSPNSSAQKEYAQALMTAVIIASLMSDRQCDWLYKDNLEWGIVALIFHMKTLDCVLKKAKAQESDIKYLKQTIDACPVYKEKEVPDLFKICIQQLMLVINDESNSVKTQKIDIIHSIINILTDSYVTSFEKYASLLTILSQVTDLPVCLQHFFTATFYTKQKVLLDAIIQHPLPYLSALIEDENKSLVLNEIESIKQQYAAHSDDFYSIVQFSDITFDALFEKKKIFYAYLSEYILCHQAHDTYALLNNNDTSFDEVYGNVVYDIVALNHISSAPYMLRASKYHLFAKIYLMECSATSVQSEFLLSMVNTIGQHVDRVSFLGELCMLDFNIGLNVLKIQSDFDTIVYDVFVRMANQFAHKGIIPSAIEQVVNELNINLNVFYAGLIDRALHSQDLLFFEFFTKTNFDVKGFNNKALSKKVMLRLKNLPQNDRLEEYLFLLEVLVLCKPEGFETIKQKSRLMSFIKYDIKKLTVYAYMQGLVDVIPILIKRAMNNLKNISSNFNNFIISSIISEYHQCRLEKEKQLFIEKGIHSPAAYIQLVDKTFENDLVPISHFVSQHKQKTEMLFSRYKFPEVLDFEVFPDSQLIENIQDHTTQPDAMVFSKENLETHLNKVGIRRLVIN